MNVAWFRRTGPARPAAVVVAGARGHAERHVDVHVPALASPKVGAPTGGGAMPSRTRSCLNTLQCAVGPIRGAEPAACGLDGCTPCVSTWAPAMRAWRHGDMAACCCRGGIQGVERQAAGHGHAGCYSISTAADSHLALRRYSAELHRHPQAFHCDPCTPTHGHSLEGLARSTWSEPCLNILIPAAGGG
jgi:hypothetical protein